MRTLENELPRDNFDAPTMSLGPLYPFCAPCKTTEHCKVPIPASPHSEEVPLTEVN